MSNSAYMQRQTQADPGRLAPSHSPRHLRATAHLYGLSSAALTTARVLVLGCGTAEGLLPFASAYPGARVIGIDASDALLTRGREVIDRLRLDNVELSCQDYGALDETLGEFDYIIITGLYSYLQPDVAQVLLGYCGRHLSPLGLMYVDYHVYPGAKAIEVVRDAVLLHAHAAQTEADAKASAKAALTLFSDGMAALNPMGQALDTVAKRIAMQLEGPDDASTPAALSATACYFIEFAGRAAEAGLAYAGDSQWLSEIALNFGTGVSLSNSLLTFGQSGPLKQQYLDFATSRGFRQTLLVSTSRGAELRPSPDLERMRDLRWASGLQRLAGHHEVGGVTYVNHLGQGITIRDEVTQTVVNTLAHSWPASLPYTTLLTVLMLSSGLDDTACRKTLDASLKLLLEHNVIHYSLDNSPYDEASGSVNHVLGWTLLPHTEPQTGLGFNFWQEPVHLRLSPQQKQFAASIAGGHSLASLASAASTDLPVVAQLTDASEIAELLHLLRRYALVCGSLEAWLTLLQDGLRDSGGSAPYCGLYVSALARHSLESELFRAEAKDIALPPSLLSQANRMLEHVRQHDVVRAEAVARRLTQLSPNFIDAWEVLVAILCNANHQEEALQCALRMLQHAPADFRSFMLLSVALSRLQRTSEAISAGRRAVEMAPHNAEAHSALGDALSVELRYQEAKVAYENALVYDPMHRKSRLNICKSLIDMGDIVSAERAAQDATSAFPDAMAAHNNLLFAVNYSPDKSGSEVFSAYQECDKQFFQPFRTKWRKHTNSRVSNRKLKIGYVSPDFRRHSGNNFVEPHFILHDRHAFEITAYAELTTEDAVTARFKGYFDNWVPTSRLSDTELDERIRADKIDILIDLAGHTQGNRLSVFARKPTPVSVTWMGYGYTTGLSAIDYILLDETTAPVGCEHFFSEKIWRLRSGCPYSPVPGMGDVNELPAITTGSVTFGTLSRAIRINYRVVRTWAAILKRLPNSRLVIDSGSYRDAAMCDALARRFEELGINRNRLSIGFNSPPWDVLREIDIGLDCFPHNSGVTLVESLYMGVPYVTLAERASVGRLGGSFLNSIGHPEWICQTEEEYVEKAVALATDLPRLASIRKNLRQEMQNSALMDQTGFTGEFEAALKKMFGQWCEAQA